MTTTRSIDRVARAISSHARERVRHDAPHGLKVGRVRNADPLVVELIEHDIILREEEGELLLTQSVREYLATIGLDENDSVLVALLETGDFYLVDVLSPDKGNLDDYQWGDLDGGAADSNYGGTAPIDCGTA